MGKETTIIIAILWGASIILFLKWLNIYKRLKEKVKYDCTCTDIGTITTYQKTTKIYYYSYMFNNEEYSFQDKIKNNLLFKPKKNDKYSFYLNKNNLLDIVTPYQLFIFKTYQFIIITLIIISLFLFI